MTCGHAALVLAAGGSLRLGRPKQLLTRNGETLVHRATRLAVDTAADPVLVVVGAGREAVEAAVGDLPCETVFNPGWQAGLASSLRAAAPRILDLGSSVLIATCDQPALEASDFRSLLAGAHAAASGCAATRLADTVGVPAVVPAEWFATASDLHADQGFGARLRALDPGQLFLLESVDLGIDIDTQADFRHAVAKGWLDGQGPA